MNDFTKVNAIYAEYFNGSMMLYVLRVNINYNLFCSQMYNKANDQIIKKPYCSITEGHRIIILHK